MAQENKNSERENISGSVRQAHRLSTGRKREQQRVAGGNVRGGQAESVKKVVQRARSKRVRSTKRSSIR
jgi:hypothetical protein